MPDLTFELTVKILSDTLYSNNLTILHQYRRTHPFELLGKRIEQHEVTGSLSQLTINE